MDLIGNGNLDCFANGHTSHWKIQFLVEGLQVRKDILLILDNKEWPKQACQSAISDDTLKNKATWVADDIEDEGWRSEGIDFKM